MSMKELLDKETGLNPQNDNPLNRIIKAATVAAEDELASSMGFVRREIENRAKGGKIQR